jgi:hypothetical protein
MSALLPVVALVVAGLRPSANGVLMNFQQGFVETGSFLDETHPA